MRLLKTYYIIHNPASLRVLVDANNLANFYFGEDAEGFVYHTGDNHAVSYFQSCVQCGEYKRKLR
ncbi:hypothetical protein pVco7_gp033 [Vibrio phage pVco-7]|uniref:Uncharacterized protein n=1 Tax=Vibrio phage pVco-5 TaxID=1965485 RepID=A0A1W6JUU0_9CAUD|nr:hypothetical protein KNT61_gp034 [Vibrio phage pVco-5]ARM71022.1 hypothetical protein pVco5_034 [Vibrio phage pVco-5]